ncbi:MAG: hypothetical protein MUC43_01825 [Pirellula sp.]|jgi:hypothetical protein|nr:hypothetical protein [Pirellula sp.]
MIDSGFQDVAGLAKRLLMDSHFASIRGLDVRMTNEHLELYGEVETFFLKQVAQETIRSATRSFEVVNAVTVRSSWCSEKKQPIPGKIGCEIDCEVG